MPLRSPIRRIRSSPSSGTPRTLPHSNQQLQIERALEQDIWTTQDSFDNDALYLLASVANVYNDTVTEEPMSLADVIGQQVVYLQPLSRLLVPITRSPVDRQPTNNSLVGNSPLLEPSPTQSSGSEFSSPGSENDHGFDNDLGFDNPEIIDLTGLPDSPKSLTTFKLDNWNGKSFSAEQRETMLIVLGPALSGEDLDKLELDDVCRICTLKYPDALCTPCGHFEAHFSCLKTWWDGMRFQDVISGLPTKSSTNCLICRSHVQKLIRIRRT